MLRFDVVTEEFRTELKGRPCAGRTARAPWRGRASIGALQLALPLLAFLLLSFLGGCATAPPGSGYARTPSVALSDPQATRLGRQFADESRQNEGRSAFRIFNVGVDGFLMRLEMINSAERTLDLQYYIFRADESGHLITEALVGAADRGVRVRVLVD